MMIKVSIILLFFLFTGCNSCVHNLYGTNSYEFLNLKFENSNLRGAFVYSYIDSVYSRGIIVPDSIKSKFYRSDQQHDIDFGEKLVYFNSNPQEYYLLGSDIAPCWIEAIYNPSISEIAIYKKDRLSNAELERVQSRFSNEILVGAEKYGKQNNIPDSLLYNK